MIEAIQNALLTGWNQDTTEQVTIDLVVSSNLLEGKSRLEKHRTILES